MAPGYYSQLLNVWERPRGTYPITMVTLDLLLTVTMVTKPPPIAWGSSQEYLASVAFVMREIFVGFHKWCYRHSGDKDSICMCALSSLTSSLTPSLTLQA